MKRSGKKIFYRVDEVAEVLNSSSRTVYRLIADGELLAFRVRSSLRVKQESLDIYIKAQIQKFQFEEGIESIEKENIVTSSPSSPMPD